MKQLLKKITPALFLMTIVSVVFLAKCTPKNHGDVGYTGLLTNPQAITLSKVYHFIEKDSIDKWTERYKTYKDSISRNHLPGVGGSIFQDSSSFYNTIIRKIIGNENSIGLRVLNGMDAEKKVHTIFVGINADYSSLYIPEPTELRDKKRQTAFFQNPSPFAQAPGVIQAASTGKFGGAEMSPAP